MTVYRKFDFTNKILLLRKILHILTEGIMPYVPCCLSSLAANSCPLNNDNLLDRIWALYLAGDS